MYIKDEVIIYKITRLMLTNMIDIFKQVVQIGMPQLSYHERLIILKIWLQKFHILELIFFALIVVNMCYS